MNFAFSDEQEELRAAVRRFLAEKSPESEVRRLMDTTEGYDPAVWSQMADQLGLQSLTIPEEFGGSGFTYVELLVVLEEMGAALLCAPFFSSVALAANALLTLGRRRGEEELPARHRVGRDDRHAGHHRGQRKVGLQRHRVRGDEEGRRLGAQRPQDVRARRPRRQPDHRGGPHRRGRHALRGPGRRAGADPHAAARRWTRRASRRGSSSPTRRPRSSAATAAPSPGCPRRSTSPRWRWRPSRWAGRSACSMRRWSTPRPVSSSGGPSAASRPSSTSAPTCCSRSSRPSRPPTTRPGPPPRTPTSCRSWRRLAKSYCSEAYFHAAAENIQIHGGIGFTWEHPAHLYFKRAKSSELLLGDPSYHRELLAQRIGI